ncbi:MAG: cytochrome c [Stellaceae bacterium]
MRIARLLLGTLVVLALAVGSFFLLSNRPEIAAVDGPNRPAFHKALVAEGAQFAAIGNCDVCHTVPGGPAYAGSRPIPTPFGTVYSANITPDPKTGIGSWSEEAFQRAMRRGVSRQGYNLYPAFPYDHYAKLSDNDIRALYAFVMTRMPVDSRPPPNALPFPLSMRRVVTIWNLLFLDTAPFDPDPNQTAKWNRGAYLVQGLGHCGDCHTPRNFVGAEEHGNALAGGVSEGWQVPALNGASPAPVPWDVEHLFAYLHQGWDAEHGAAAGPMQAVTDDLSRVDERDVDAIATYLASLQRPISPERRHRIDEVLARASHQETSLANEHPGNFAATLFAGACANCHVGGPSMVPPRGIDLSLSSAVSGPDPRNAILITLYGIHPDEGQRGPLMPPFDNAFTDEQIAALLGYIRENYSDQPAWDNLEARIREIRHRKERS